MTLKNILHAQEQPHLKALLPLLAFPSLSADPAYRKDLLACAEWLANFCKDAGFDTVELLQTQGAPALFCQIGQDPKKETLLFYGHYDVQPADPLDEWESPPFQAQIRHNNIYARGVADDKGQVFCHLLALKTLIQHKIPLAYNVKLLIEGEEESGSPSLPALLEKEKQRLSAQHIVISDTPMFSKNQASLCTSLRGLIHSEITLQTQKSDLHSGQHGGSLYNPLHVMASLLHQLKDEKGKILIPHFYDEVKEISAEQQQSLKKLNFSSQNYLASVGANAEFGEEGFSNLARRWYRPSLDCNGLWGGYTGEGSKTVLPAKASMKLSIRLVANQDPEKIAHSLNNFLQDRCPKGVSLHCESHAAGAAYHCPEDSPLLKKASQAITKAFGQKPYFSGEGGSIPIVPLMEKALNATVVLMGFNLPEDGIHGPNEHFACDRFFKGIHAAAELYAEAAAPPA